MLKKDCWSGTLLLHFTPQPPSWAPLHTQEVSSSCDKSEAIWNQIVMHLILETINYYYYYLCTLKR